MLTAAARPDVTGAVRCIGLLLDHQPLILRLFGPGAGFQQRGVSTGVSAHAASTSKSFDSNAAFASSQSRPAESPSSPSATATSLIPPWLKRLLPGGKHLLPEADVSSFLPGLPRGMPASSSLPPPEAESADREKQRKEYADYLEQNKDLTVDAFIALNKELWMNSDAPRPVVLSIPRQHVDYERYVDWKRVSYLRTLQHEKISSTLTEDEKVRIKSDGKSILGDRRFLQAVAERTGVYIDEEVKDCVRGYLETRDRMRRLYRWVVVLGEPEPLTQEHQSEALKEMEALEKDEDRMERLERQDRKNCPILPVLDFLGHDAICSRTGLKYFECCGGVAGRPPGLARREDKRHMLRAGLGQRKGKTNQVPRSERAVRLAAESQKESLKWEK